MAEVAIGTYIRFFLPSGGATTYAFQNFHVGETREYGDVTYTFSGFGFTGTTVSLQGNNISSQLVFAVNQLSLNFVQQAADERWIIQVRTVWLDPDTYEETGNYTDEIFQITAYQHDGSRLGLDLGSPLDAVAGQAPRRTLSQYLVGSLPSTGTISFV